MTRNIFEFYVCHQVILPARINMAAVCFHLNELNASIFNSDQICATINQWFYGFNTIFH